MKLQSIITIKTWSGILAIIFALAAPAHAQIFLNNGLVAYYQFNGNANDATTNGNNGTLMGATAFGMDRFGNSNSCLLLPGTQGTGTGVSIPSLDNMPYRPVTYTAWFWLSNYVLGSVMGLVGRDQCGSQSEGDLCISSDLSHPYTNWIVYYSGETSCQIESLTPVKQWTQVAVTIDASGNYNFYLNGQLQPSEGSAPAGSPLGFWIGNSAPGGCQNAPRYAWSGMIDDVRIYNRALSSNEVQELYLYESGTPCSTPSYYATATATVTNGFVVDIAVDFGGCGFTNPPPVLIQGGGGSGATATALVTNGFVYGVTVDNAGSNYTSAPSVVIGAPLTILSQPQSETVNVHNPASFSVTAVGAPAVDYQWTFDGTNIAGATSSILAFTNVVQSNLGTYGAIISNIFGSIATSNAVLGMYPYLVDPFGGLVTDWGYTNTLSVIAGGSGPLDYQWYDNGTALAGATNQTLTFTNIQFTNGGLYTVVVSSPYGSVTNAPEQVVIDPSGIAIGLSPTVTITGVVGYNYIIQRTPDLSDTNSWVTVTNLTLTSPVQIWADTNINTAAPSTPKEYYRILPGL